MITYEQIINSWMMLCYHYETIEEMTKDVYKLTLEEFNKIKKETG